MYLGMEPKNCDCILGLGCNDFSVPERCVELYKQGYADIIIFSGGTGKSTENWDKSEAEKFFDIAISLGVPKNKIYIENKSTNTGDNFRFTEQLIKKEKLNINSFLIVQKPYMERRCYAAFKAIIPDKECCVTSSQAEMDEYFKTYEKINGSSKELINILVGDVQRMRVYVDKGWQIKQDVPENVWDAYLELVNRGYSKYVINN
ncbi:MAG: YdcF family protein [Bacilli bacterium]|nr:YdcF family protein [Bacilli bacterium]